MTQGNTTIEPPSDPASTTAVLGDVARQFAVPTSRGTSVLFSAPSSKNLLEGLEQLFDENIAAKIWRVAALILEGENPPNRFPEYVLATGPDAGKYTLREADFWTCGFFPGSLYGLLERAVKFPRAFPCFVHGSTAEHETRLGKIELQNKLLHFCRSWSVPIRGMATRTDTHDMGFIIQPALQLDWELNGNRQSLENVLTAAKSLATRYDERVKAIRSWDKLTTKKRNITSLEDDFLIIIDGMCNLDLLYYTGHHISSPHLISLATSHAHTVTKTLLRPETARSRSLASTHSIQAYSTYHVANICPKTGHIKQKVTAQGYADDSTWARGQAWGIMGYAQTFNWTRDRAFLDISCGLAEYFITRLETAPKYVEVLAVRDDPEACTGRYVPLWDFDAPILDTSRPLRDSSAGVIAANGMLLLHQGLLAVREYGLAARYLEMAMRIVRETLALCLAADRCGFVMRNRGAKDGNERTDNPIIEAIPVQDIDNGGVGNGNEVENGNGEQGPMTFDAILMHATANFNEFDYRRYWDHGLVYADYFLIEFGNKLLRLGLV
ncbi:hypothetical protein AJ79_01061 [Helicocarpus griseus UAMH5409]|uniref:Unsaturated glucuronyl hydrolase n=1 Tax=Helicocarpus griseus UAMH5409 TaxID=1447875 RepID=A0A2B7Y8S7_9EURO|nr:hypothetical protein AJ79_01061 [Helicocarpus griseus UAMH5409]